MQIYTRLSGGLGNQLFQYAFLYSVIRENGWKKEVACVMHHNCAEDPRNFSLRPFKCSVRMNLIDETECGLFFFLQMMKRKILFHTYKLLSGSEHTAYEKLVKHGVYYSGDPYFYPSNLNCRRKNIYIEGCFQSHRYFKKYKDEIRQELILIPESSAENEAMLQELAGCQSVCVHIRRGDYLNNNYAKDLAICDYEYYVKAMGVIASQIAEPVFYIFSNTHEDIEWIKKNYDFSGYEVRFVDLGNTDYEELRLMQNCKHFIISNSTYSWWAQFLAAYGDKIVVAPSVWNRKKTADSSNIYEPEWQLIEV